MADGWICLHRQIRDHWLFQEKRIFSRFEAWVDLVMMANHKDSVFPLGNELITVQRGDVVTSEVKLMERWRWSKTKLRAFLMTCERHKMITKKSDRKKTTITIVNYSVYNDLQTIERPQKNHGETASRPPADTNNNVNNDNNVKQKRDLKDNVPFSEIIDYLNGKADTKYKASAKATQNHIKARWNEGYTIDDFKTVIDKKVIEWRLDPKMSQYLRPETLFGTKFESYLNQKEGAYETHRGGVRSGAYPSKDGIDEDEEFLNSITLGSPAKMH